MPRLKYLLCTKSHTAFAGFNLTGELLNSSSLQTDKLPSLIESLLHLVGNIGNLGCRNNVVPAVNKTVETLVIPETVWLFPILVEVLDLTPM